MALAVPRGLEPPTFGLGMRCWGPSLFWAVPGRPDTYSVLWQAGPAHPPSIPNVPASWVAKSVAIRRRQR
jgi:hypothetical protein